MSTRCRIAAWNRARWSTRVQVLGMLLFFVSLPTCFLVIFNWTAKRVPEYSSGVDDPEMIYMRKFGRTRGLPTPEETLDMTRRELTYIYHSYLDNIDYLCQRKIRMGRIGDGGWEVCDDYEFRPIQPCIVYSFGIKDDFSFDDDVALKYKCQVFSFDPGMKTLPLYLTSGVKGLRVGLSGEAGALPAQFVKLGWNVKTLTGIKAMLNHQELIIDILKIDIEYSEWLALVDILKKGELNRVRQFLIEFHTNPNDDVNVYRQRLPLLAQIEALGFRRFCTHKNPMGRQQINEYPVSRVSAMEVYFVNTRLRR